MRRVQNQSRVISTCVNRFFASTKPIFFSLCQTKEEKKSYHKKKKKSEKKIHKKNNKSKTN